MQTATGCRRKRSGNTLVGQEPRPPIFGEIIQQSWAIMPGSTKTRVDILGQSARNNPIPVDSTNWLVTSGNGAMISTRWIIIRKRLEKIPAGPRKVKRKSFVAALGDLVLRTAALATAIMKVRAMPMSASD